MLESAIVTTSDAVLMLVKILVPIFIVAVLFAVFTRR